MASILDCPLTLSFAYSGKASCHFVSYLKERVTWQKPCSFWPIPRVNLRPACSYAYPSTFLQSFAMLGICNHRHGFLSFISRSTAVLLLKITLNHKEWWLSGLKDKHRREFPGGLVVQDPALPLLWRGFWSVHVVGIAKRINTEDILPKWLRWEDGCLPTFNLLFSSSWFHLLLQGLFRKFQSDMAKQIK